MKMAMVAALAALSLIRSAGADAGGQGNIDALAAWVHQQEPFSSAPMSRTTSILGEPVARISAVGGKVVVDVIGRAHAGAQLNLQVRPPWTDRDGELLRILCRHIAGSASSSITPELAADLKASGRTVDQDLFDGHLQFGFIDAPGGGFYLAQIKRL